MTHQLVQFASLRSSDKSTVCEMSKDLSADIAYVASVMRECNHEYRGGSYCRLCGHARLYNTIAVDIGLYVFMALCIVLMCVI